MKKWNLIVDVKKCVGCYNCFLSCKDEHVGNEFPGYAQEQPLHGHEWIEIEVVERGQTPMVDLTYVPKMCNHCDDAPCIKAGNGAVYKREDGIVIVDPDRSKGRKDIVDSCPYGAIWWNEDKQVPQTWIFDAHLLDQGWQEPRCTQVCPTGALKALKVTDEEMQAQVRSEGLQGIRPEYKTEPRVHYKNLKRVTTCFIAGAVTKQGDDGIADCAENVKVRLLQGNEVIAEIETDNYGDFKLDELAPDGGTYTVSINADSSGSRSIDVELTTSTYLGTINL